MNATAPLPRSEEWHEVRRNGIGASDVPAICGMSSFATPLDVWEQKVGLRLPSEDTPLLEWGRRLEPVIADAFADRWKDTHNGRDISVRRRVGDIRYRDWPVLFAHLDRTTPAGPLECKASMTTRGWGEDGSSEVPTHVALQVQAQLLCADRPRGFVAALLGYRDFRVYEIQRDDELLNDSVLPLLREFWESVETRTPPAPDGSESYSAFLRRMHPRDVRDERPATPEEGLVVGQLLVATEARIAAEKAEKTLKQHVMAAIAEDGGLVGPGWRITYRLSKDITTVHWDAIANALGARFQQELVADNTETKPGSRRFLVTVEEE